MEVKGNFIVKGNYVDVHDNTTVNLNLSDSEVHVDKVDGIDGELCGDLEESANREGGVGADAATIDFMPILKNDRAATEQFLSLVRKAEPRDVTLTVQSYYDSGLIQPKTTKRCVYDLLKKHRFYMLTLSNFNMQVSFDRK